MTEFERREKEVAEILEKNTVSLEKLEQWEKLTMFQLQFVTNNLQKALYRLQQERSEKK